MKYHGRFSGKRLFAMLAAFTVAVAGLALAPATPALAAGCHQISAEAGSGYTEGSTTVFYTPTYTVPSTSGCNDINITRTYAYFNPDATLCVDARVRFYPSSGGSYTNAWKHRCTSRFDTYLWVVASAVSNGTRYRVEFAANTTIDTTIYD